MAGLTEAQKRDAVVRTILGEAANQGPAGMAAVASVIANRANSGQFGSTDPYVIATQPNQFSANNPIGRGGNNVGRNASIMSPEYQQAAAAYDGVMNGTIPDQTGGATYYHTVDINTPRDWGNVAQTAQIGQHVFYSPTNHPVPPANIPSIIPTGIDASAYGNAAGPGMGNAALGAIRDATTPVGLAPRGGIPDLNTVLGHDFAALGMAAPQNAASQAAETAAARIAAPRQLSDAATRQAMQGLGAPLTAQGANDFYSGFPLPASSIVPPTTASATQPLAGQVQLPINARPASVGAGSSMLDNWLGYTPVDASAPVRSAPTAAPSSSIANADLNQVLYGGNPPAYQSQGSVSDVPKWAVPSIVPSLTVPQPGQSGTVVNGAVNGAIRQAAPQIASALGPVFGTARSVLDNLPAMSATQQRAPSAGYHANTGDPAVDANLNDLNTYLNPPASVPVPSTFASRPSYPSTNNTGGGVPLPSIGYVAPASNVPVYGSGSSLGAPSSQHPSTVGDIAQQYNGSGSSSMAMNDRSGAGNTYSQPKTITQQVVNPAWTQWQSLSAPGDSQFSGTDSGLSWAGLNTGDPNNPFSSFASPANIPAMPSHYVTKTIANPNYVTPPLAFPTSGNPVAGWFNGTKAGGLLGLLFGGQNASDALFGGSTGLPSRGGGLLGALGAAPRPAPIGGYTPVPGSNGGNSTNTSGSQTYVPSAGGWVATGSSGDRYENDPGFQASDGSWY